MTKRKAEGKAKGSCARHVPVRREPRVVPRRLMFHRCFVANGEVVEVEDPQYGGVDGPPDNCRQNMVCEGGNEEGQDEEMRGLEEEMRKLLQGALDEPATRTRGWSNSC